MRARTAPNASTPRRTTDVHRRGSAAFGLRCGIAAAAPPTAAMTAVAPHPTSLAVRAASPPADTIMGRAGWTRAGIAPLLTPR